MSHQEQVDHLIEGQVRVHGLYEVISLQEQVDRSTSAQKVAVTLTGVLAGLALVLAAIGLYGVMSYTVSQSTRELGLRMALGARTPELFRLVISRGLALTAGGILLGAAGALGLTRLLGYLLWRSEEHTSELQSRVDVVCRLLLEKKKARL